MKPPASARPDWRIERDTIDLAEVAIRLLGPAPGRRGERGGRLWWNCPFHEDRNPSFCVRPGDATWHCFGCGAAGDAAALVMRLEGVSFPEAIAYLTGGPVPRGKAVRNPARCSSVNNSPQARLEPKTRPPAAYREKPSAEERIGFSPSGMPEAEALALVETAAVRLWTPEGAGALAYLHDRGLTDETIRAARLGFVPPLDLPGRPPWRCHPVVPRGSRLALVKLRQPEGYAPKYREVFRDPARLVCYPGPEVIEPGRPLVVTEGELDALLLGQELRDLAAVVTIGSASARPAPAILGSLLPAAPWYVGTDADEAGDTAASGWPASARRVRPPGPFKDWTEARQGGMELRRWWIDRLGGNEAPPLFSWDELAALRWGPARDDPEVQEPDT